MKQCNSGCELHAGLDHIADTERMLHRDLTPPTDDVDEPSKAVTVGDIIESVGLSCHHFAVLAVVWGIWILAGWVGTLVPYVLDAAADANGSWAHVSGADNVLTVRDRSVAMLWAGLAAMIGNPLLGNLSDAKGRVFATTCGTVLCCITVTGFALARTKWLLIALLVGTPFSRDGITGITMSLLVEWLPVYWRGFLVVTLHAIWNVGRLGLTLWWVVCPPSKNWLAFFGVAAVLPFFVSLFLIFRGSRYESPRWLAVSGHTEWSMSNLRRAAQNVGADSLPLGWDSGGLQVEDEAGQHIGLSKQSKRAQFKELAAPGVKWCVFLLCIYNATLFFGSNGFFIWALEYFKYIQVDPRPAMIAAPLGKVASNILLIVPGPQRCPVDCFQRLPLMRAGFLGYALSFLALCLVRNTVLMASLVFISHVFEEILWTVGGLYMTEAFPTTIRNTALGVVFMVGHVGSILSASLSGELMELWTYLPMAAMASVLFVGLGICFILPPGHQDTSLVDTVGS